MADMSSQFRIRYLREYQEEVPREGGGTTKYFVRKYAAPTGEEFVLKTIRSTGRFWIYHLTPDGQEVPVPSVSSSSGENLIVGPGKTFTWRTAMIVASQSIQRYLNERG